MDFSVIENHIFAGGGTVTETIADINSERHPVNPATSGPPVPYIVISPYTPSPVQNPHSIFRPKPPLFFAQTDTTAGRQTIDFLIIIKGFRLICPRCCNAHTLRRFLQQPYFHIQILSTLKALKMALNLPAVKNHRIFQMYPMILEIGIPIIRMAPEAKPPHCKRDQHGFRMMPGIVKIQHGNTDHPQIT